MINTWFILQHKFFSLGSEKGIWREQGNCLQGGLCAGSSVASKLRNMVISLHIWSIMSSLGLASTREMLTNWTEFSSGHQDDFRAGAADREGEAETTGFDQA